jgi:hypothetical protein
MTNIDPLQLRFVVGGLAHPPNNPQGNGDSRDNFKKTFEHHRDNGTPMWPNQRFEFKADPDNWAGGRGGGGGTATG